MNTEQKENGLSPGRVTRATLTAFTGITTVVTTFGMIMAASVYGLPNHNRLRVQQYDHERFLLFSSLSAPLLIFILFLVFNSVLAVLNIAGLFTGAIDSLSGFIAQRYPSLSLCALTSNIFGTCGSSLLLSADSLYKPWEISSLYMSLLVSPLTLYATYLALTGSSRFRRACFFLLFTVLVYLVFILLAAGLYDYKPVRLFHPVMIVFNASHLLLYLIIFGCIALLALTALYLRIWMLWLIPTILLVHRLVYWTTGIDLLTRLELYALFSLQTVARIPDTPLNFAFAGITLLAVCMLYLVTSKGITRACSHRSYREKLLQEVGTDEVRPNNETITSQGA